MPKVSIIILNWNGKRFLKNCLDSLEKLTYSSLEVIVVDNNSIDGSSEFIQKNYPKFTLIKNKENYGFAKGNNIGFHASSGKYILFLNNDTVVNPNFLEPLVEDCGNDPKIGCIQPQIRLMENKSFLDQVGSYISFVGFLYHYGYRKKYSAETYGKKREIFSAKGACILFPRKVLDRVGLFDEDFFIFFEETDLCFRVWLSGHKVVYEPKSLIYHVAGGDTRSSDKFKYERRIYLIFRNTNCSYLKNFGTYNFITIYPFFIIAQICLFIFFLIQLRFNLLRAIIKAYWWNIINVKNTLTKRRHVQNNIRKVSDRDLNKFIKLTPRLSYYYYSYSLLKNNL